MADYRWTALDEAGRNRTGHMAAADEAEVRTRLLERKLFATAVVPGAAPAPLARTPRLGPAALALFTRQLATLLTVTPVDEALETIGRQSEKPATRAVIGHVRQGIAQGERLPDALAREPRSFDALYCAIIASGDSAGRLVPTLERLALLIERQAAIRARVQGALAYPAVLAVIALGVVAALMIFVVPRMVEQFDQAGAPLPLVTRAVMGVSLFLAHGWGAILLVLILAMAAAWFALRDEARRLTFDRLLLRLPLFGRMLRDLHAARFARTLATMVSARLPLVEGLELARDTVRNRAQRAALALVMEQVRAGGSLSAGMAQSGLFPPLLTYLAASGESSGQLDAMLERAADTLEREFDGSTAVALALLEPAVIVMMGLVVALIILSVLLPVLQMESLVAL